MTPAHILAQHQSELLDALSGQGSAGTRQFNPRGLQAYQANRAALAEKTLAGTYPVTFQLIGAESFGPLSHHFWRQHPPQRGDLAQWGESLADFLAAAPQLAHEPFLADVARVEWALHRAATAPDAAPDIASFALLSDVGGAQPVCLAVGPGVWMLVSAYPVVSIINAHLFGQPTLAEAGERLRQRSGERALVWRQGFKPRLRALTSAEYGLITAQVQRQPLDAALDQVVASQSAFDFNVWLGDAVQTGLITGAVLAAT